MYVFGGCNYEIKKCYNDIYRISLNKMDSWEKVEYQNKNSTLNKATRIDPENSNFAPFMGELITLSSCNSDECINKEPAILLSRIDCTLKKCKNSVEVDFKITKKVDFRIDELKIEEVKLKKKKKFDTSPIFHNVTFNGLSIDCVSNYTKPAPKINQVIIKKPEIPQKNKTTNKKNNKTKAVNSKNKTEHKKNNHSMKNKTEKKNKTKHKKNKTKDKKHNNKTHNNNSNAKHRVLSNDTHNIQNALLEKEKIKAQLREILKSMSQEKIKELVVPKKPREFMEDVGFILINDKLQKNKTHVEDAKKDEALKANNAELKKISEALVELQKHVSKIEHAEIAKRNNEESSRKNQVSSNYMLMSNLEKTNTISNNLQSLQKEIMTNFAKNFTSSIHTNFKEIYNRLSLIDDLNKRIDSLQKQRVQQYIVDEKEKNCSNGKFVRSLEKCVCNEGFFGINCENEKTCPNQCNGNGKCSLGKCFCNPDFTGNLCENPKKCEKDCNNRGTCKNGRCFCDAGFSSEDCSKKLKCPNNCNKKGICFRQKCLCSPGWGGKDCSILKIGSKPCYNNCNGKGKCVNDQCFCNPGFEGTFCGEKIQFSCPPFPNNTGIQAKNMTWSPCNNNGICKFGMCFCFPGFKVLNSFNLGR
jgi:hypothetical protein